MNIFQLKNFDIFLIFAQNIDCGYSLEPPHRGGSNEYPQSMFWSKNKKTRYTPAHPSFCYIKVGFKGVYITRTCFHNGQQFLKATETFNNKILHNIWAASRENQLCRFRTGPTQTDLYKHRKELEAWNFGFK